MKNRSPFDSLTDDSSTNRASKSGTNTQSLNDHTYYDVPMLKPSVWKWEIAIYFFLGGLSAGAFLLARLAARFGGKRYADVTDAGTAIAATTFLPCAPLLIHDLGDPKRFLYMLRVFKPQSPMSLGSWVLTGYGATVTLTVLNRWRRATKQGEKLSELLPKQVVATGDGVVEAVIDGAGLPLALLLAGYTGVLLSTTATPIWTRKIWLGALFSASAVATGAEAIELALEATDPCADQRASHLPLKQIQQAAKLAETIAMVGYLKEAGSLANPITRGRYAAWHHIGTVGLGLVTSTLCGMIPVKSSRTRRALRIGGAVAGLAGGFALRWAMTHAGQESGKDPDSARKASSKPRGEQSDDPPQ